MEKIQQNSPRSVNHGDPIDRQPATRREGYCGDGMTPKYRRISYAPFAQRHGSAYRGHLSRHVGR